MITPQELLHARKAKKLTQTDVASAVGVSQQTISMWEAGVYQVEKVKHQQRLCEVLGIDCIGGIETPGDSSDEIDFLMFEVFDLGHEVKALIDGQHVVSLRMPEGMAVAEKGLLMLFLRQLGLTVNEILRTEQGECSPRFALSIHPPTGDETLSKKQQVLHWEAAKEAGELNQCPLGLECLKSIRN